MLSSQAVETGRFEVQTYHKNCTTGWGFYRRLLQGSATFFALRTGLKLKFFRRPAFKNHKCSTMNIYYNSCKLLQL